MKKFISLLLFAAANIFAGTTTTTGTATVSRPAEFIKVSINFHSVCYDDPKLATKANNEAVENTRSFLSSFLDLENGIDDLKVSLDLSGPYSKSYRDNKGNTIVICQDTFQQKATITFKTSDLGHFSENWNEIQNHVNSQFSKTESNTDMIAMTYAKISNPTADVCAETHKEMSKEAKALAHENARDELKLIVDSCNICGNIELVKVEQGSAYHEKSRSYSESAFSMPSNNDSSIILSLSFDEITKTENVTHHYSFPTTLCCFED